MFTACLLLLPVALSQTQGDSQTLPALRPAETRVTPAPLAQPSRQAAQVAVDIMIVSFPDTFVPQLLKDQRLVNQFGGPELHQLLNPPGDRRTHPAIVSAKRRLDCLLETLQADRRTAVTCLPELAFTSGQSVALRVPPEDHGFFKRIVAEQNYGPGVPVVRAPEAQELEPMLTFRVQPTVSADRRNIQLHFQMMKIQRTHAREVEKLKWTDHHSRIASVLITTENHEPLYETLRVDDTWQIPAGHTLVLSGWTAVQEEQRESKPLPLVNSLPGCEHLFRSTIMDTERQRVLIIVTPRVVGE